MRKIKIIGDGTRRGTEVIDVESGQPINGVMRVQLDIPGELIGSAIAQIDVWSPAVDLLIDATIYSNGLQQIEQCALNAIAIQSIDRKQAMLTEIVAICHALQNEIDKPQHSYVPPRPAEPSSPVTPSDD